MKCHMSGMFKIFKIYIFPAFSTLNIERTFDALLSNLQKSRDSQQAGLFERNPKL